MKIEKELLKSLNNQINLEFVSAYLYLALELAFANMNLNGIADWLKKQALEELEHSEKIMRYILDNFCSVELKNIAAPENISGTPLELFIMAYEHEKKVTESLKSIAKKADAVQDFITLNLMREYLIEQIEEERKIYDIISKIQLVNEANCGILLLDKELAEKK
jgi:ferritin